MVHAAGGAPSTDPTGHGEAKRVLEHPPAPLASCLPRLAMSYSRLWWFKVGHQWRQDGAVNLGETTNCLSESCGLIGMMEIKSYVSI
ncbi:hypothetical protein BRADI_4g07932v3 [Brachypodium distachyon]|uniref:Uncharacterized protein n=1 Tax=Brachypodium distachyon TaxID=15368 RepID=A0A2K2CL64_BRADI|nr:hypothetical protein BRADI_4g07932v3 [Brachypodium distachyon]